VIGLTLAVSVLLASQISSFWQLLAQTTTQIANAGAPAGTDPGRQMLFVLDEFPSYLGVLGRSLWYGDRAYYYLESFIGILGWLDVRLPAYLIHAYWLVLFGAAVGIPTGDLGLTLWRRLLLLAMLVVGVLLIMTAMYLGWIPVGGRLIGGVQGRYFIPFAPLLFLALSGSAATRRLESSSGFGGFLALFVPCFYALAMIPTIYALIARYYRG